jgi:actin-related protein
MTLYSTSKTSGLVLDSGAMTTEIVPIIEGYIISQGICNFPISGHQLTKRFENTYKDIFDINNVCNQYWMAQKIKEQFAEILPSSKDYEELISKKNENKKEFVLPDGNIVELGNEIYEIPESIFNPSIIEMETNNLPQTVVDSINKCDISTRKELFNNIVLGGGNTLIKGFEGRLKSGIEEIKKRNCGIICLKERNYSSWIGGSGISSISNFSNKWIARNEYFDSGEKLFETNYLFNYGGIVGGKGKSMKANDIPENESEIYKKIIMNE